MSQELGWIYAFNVIVNSILSFFTATFLIWMLIRLLKVKSPRLEMACRMLPFCKVCVDLFLYQQGNWALLHGVNPLLAELGTRQLSVMVNPFIGIQLFMQDWKTFSVADLIALCTQPIWIRTVVLIAISGAFFSSGLLIARIIRTKKRIADMAKNGRSILPLELKPQVYELLKQTRTQLLATSTVTTPCIAGRTIFLPERLVDVLSKEELEAVIVHELAHLRWKDSTLRLIYSWIGALFWWIPTSPWRRRLEELQEEASDAAIRRFEISGVTLAEAILKTARNARQECLQIGFSFLRHQSPFQTRIDKMLQKPTEKSIYWKMIQGCLLGAVFVAILMGKLWIL